MKAPMGGSFRVKTKAPPSLTFRLLPVPCCCVPFLANQLNVTGAAIGNRIWVLTRASERSCFVARGSPHSYSSSTIFVLTCRSVEHPPQMLGASRGARKEENDTSKEFFCSYSPQARRSLHLEKGSCPAVQVQKSLTRYSGEGTAREI
jgi:hypothetical protein